MRSAATLVLLIFVSVLSFGTTRAAAQEEDERGELTHFGNKWGWSGTGEVFTPQLVMYRTPPHFYGNPGQVDRDVRLFLFEHGFDGFHVFVSCRWFDISESDCRKVPGADPSVDPRTFEALAMLIRKTYAAGGMVHLWLWGDEERGQTPSARPDWGGLAGPVALKVEREIAQRLGPLPGWSMGYGFDLDEWVRVEELHAWRDRLQRLLPRFHFLGGRPAGPNRGRGHGRYERWNRGLDYASFEHHEPTYAVYVAALAASPEKPVLSEDRFRVLPDGDTKHYGLPDVRRGLWHSMLAGGVANIWGYLKEGGTHEMGSAPFPNREQIHTYAEFARGRFLRDMARCSPADADPAETTLCLGVPDRSQVLLYKEDAVSLEVSLPEGSGPLPAVAVDAKRSYAELDVGPFGGGTWRAPYRSDWALAIGEYRRSPSEPPGRPAPPAGEGALAAPSELRLVSGSSERVTIAWRDDARDESGFEIERADGGPLVPGTFRPLVVVARDGARFVDEHVSPGITYWYRVRAVRPGAASVYSESLRVTASAGVTLADLRPASVEAAPLEVGDRYYVDRDYRLARVPAALADAVWIRTCNDDKLVEADRFLSFRVTRPVTVYVGFDRRARRRPEWLRGFEEVGDDIEVEGDAMRSFRLFRRDVPPGEVVLGGNSAAGADWDGGGRSHYVVAVVAR